MVVPCTVPCWIPLKAATAVCHHHYLTPAIWQRRAALAFALHCVHSHSLLFIRKISVRKHRLAVYFLLISFLFRIRFRVN